jgi:hypothetical protein
MADADRIRDPNYTPTLAEAMADPAGFVAGMTETRTVHRITPLLKLRPRDVGFDLRELRMPVILPAGEFLRVECHDADDKPAEFFGFRGTIRTILESLGYTVAPDA